jgi:hypothetical protein
MITVATHASVTSRSRSGAVQTKAFVSARSWRFNALSRHPADDRTIHVKLCRPSEVMLDLHDRQPAKKDGEIVPSAEARPP